MSRSIKWASTVVAAFALGAVAVSTSAAAQDDPRPFELGEARLLSPFGGRVAFSPDGKRLAFIGRTYADAYEIEIATGKVRNLTRDIPHQGIMRIQYLQSGDFLVTAPRKHIGPNTRAHLEMWVLDKGLRRGLQPLGEQVFEGIAVSRQRNLIAWTVVEPELKHGENWQMAFVRPTKRYIAEVNYTGGVARLVNKREIMPLLPKECAFIEPQDFRDRDSELVYSCMGPVTRGDFTISVMGNKLATGENITYHREAGAYNEVEGIAPSGAWTTVECGKQDKPGIPPLDICRLEMTPNAAMRRLVIGTAPDTTADISNPVVSPDGNWLAFQRGDSSTGEVGEGYGVYLLRLPD